MTPKSSGHRERALLVFSTDPQIISAERCIHARGLALRYCLKISARTELRNVTSSSEKCSPTIGSGGGAYQGFPIVPD